MRNVIKRCGVIFIVGPVFIIGLLLNLFMWSTCIIWGPIYYIITGRDPIDDVFNRFPVEYSFKFTDWYFKKFNLDKL